MNGFNDAAKRKGGLWPEDALEALAGWWAKQLPAEFAGAAITREQRDTFTAELVRRMKQTDPGYSDFPQVKVTTNDQLLYGALRKAGFENPLQVMRGMARVWTFAYPDGQVFVQEVVDGKNRSVPLDYPGRPDTPFMSLKDIDFSACPYYRDESRYLVVPLEKGQAYTLRQGFNDGAPDFHDGVAEEGQVLVVWEDQRGMLDALTPAHALDPRSATVISFSHVSPAAEYEKGFIDERSKTAVVHIDSSEGKNIVYTHSPPFRAWEAASTFATGTGSLYQVVKPGDYVTRSEHTGQPEVRRREARSEGWQTWLPCDQNGAVDFPMQLESATKISKPLKLAKTKAP
jgi:hypothetical protein